MYKCDAINIRKVILIDRPLSVNVRYGDATVPRATNKLPIEFEGLNI